MLTTVRILEALKAICNYQQGETVLVGVSGGADSMALLHVLHSAGIPIAVAHVNYGLRGSESDEEEKFVAEICSALTIPFYVKKTSREELLEYGTNLQESARSFRYKFFSEVRVLESMSWCAVAHNSDDNLETVLMNFLRGSGLRGLGGIRKRNEFLIRPLLEFSRVEIESYLMEQRVKWRDDSSNATDNYLRNRIRHHLVPAMMKVDERNGQGAHHSIEQLANSQTLLSSLAQPWQEKIVSHTGEAAKINKTILAQSPSPHLMLNYILNSEACPISFSESEYLELMKQQPGKQFVNGSQTLLNDRENLILILRKEDSELPFKLLRDQHNRNWSCSVVTPDDPEKYSGFEAMICGDKTESGLVVRPWIGGDKMQPLGFHGTKKVSDILTEMKLPLDVKKEFPVVVCGDDIVWIPGFRVAEQYRVTASTKTALILKWNKS